MPSAMRSLMSVVVAILAINIVLSLLSTLAKTVTHDDLSSRFVLNVVIRLVAAAVGGFVGALVAQRRPLIHGAVVGLILFGFSVSALYRLQGHFPQWYLWTLAIGTPLAVVAGAACDFPELGRRR